MKGREQVAAVCFRVRRRTIEFLLVQTRSGRWIFPKGGTEPGLTHAQAAALEAFEEAGVHGRIEEQAFASYRRADRANPAHSEDECRALAVHAHLCEVLRQERPKESGRRPTWFCSEKAKKRLQDDRGSKRGAELARIVDRAVDRILRARRLAGAVARLNDFREVSSRDGLRRVQFEAPALVQGAHHAAFFGYRRREVLGPGQPGSVEVAVAGYVSKDPRATTPRNARGPAGANQLMLVAPSRKGD